MSYAKIVVISASLLMASCNHQSKIEKTEQDYTLSDVKWTLLKYGYKESNKSEPLDGTIYTIQMLGKSSEAKGKIDCNSFFTTYQAEGGNISFSDIAPTKVLCLHSSAQVYAEQEESILSALRYAKSYSIKGDILTLTSIDSSQLIFKGEEINNYTHKLQSTK